MPRKKSHLIDVTREIQQAEERQMRWLENELGEATKRTKAEVYEVITLASERLIRQEDCFADGHIVVHAPTGETFCAVCFYVIAFCSGAHAEQVRATRTERIIRHLKGK